MWFFLKPIWKNFEPTLAFLKQISFFQMAKYISDKSSSRHTAGHRCYQHQADRSLIKFEEKEKKKTDELHFFQQSYEKILRGKNAQTVD